jgi:hypothetical protein
MWFLSLSVCLNFLGNVKAVNYKELAEDLLNAYQIMGCKASPKIHFLHFHLDLFAPNLGAMSDEQGESDFQDISTIERRYKRKLSENMLW